MGGRVWFGPSGWVARLPWGWGALPLPLFVGLRVGNGEGDGEGSGGSVPWDGYVGYRCASLPVVHRALRLRAREGMARGQQRHLTLNEGSQLGFPMSQNFVEVQTSDTN